MSNATASNFFFYLDLSKRNDPQNFKWEELPSWPGSPRILPVSAIQSSGTDNSFYLFSGRDVKPGSPTQLLDDAYRYNIAKSEWESLNRINIGNDRLTEERHIPIVELFSSLKSKTCETKGHSLMHTLRELLLFVSK